MASRSDRRFARALGEFALIVTGVLTALFLESLWQYRGDLAQEQEYLEQVQLDSQANLIRIDSAVALEQRHLEIAQTLLSAIQAPASPPVDSVRAWMSQRDEGGWWISDPRLSLGTITALVETGDLTLIRDLGVRAAILGYQGQLRADTEEFQRFVQVGVDSNRTWKLRGALRISPATAAEEDDDVRRMHAIHGDPEGIIGLESLVDAYAERVWYLQQMREATETLLTALE